MTAAVYYIQCNVSSDTCAGTRLKRYNKDTFSDEEDHACSDHFPFRPLKGDIDPQNSSAWFKTLLSVASAILHNFYRDA